MKFGHGIIGVAVAVYLVVLGCVMIPGAGPSQKLSTATPEQPEYHAASTRKLDGLPYRGAAFQIQRVDWMDKYKKSIDEIADMGFDTVSFVIDTRQENGLSMRIYLDMRMTPTPEKLSELIQHAKKRNLRVILMPVVLLDAPRGDEWRGKLKPESWDDWFDSYRSIITHFAWIAEQNKVDVLSVGSELVTAESKVSHWTRLIREVRQVYHGRLTYSANWDHYTSVPFWDQLDLIGMNSYYTLGDNRDVTVEEIVSRWEKIQEDLFKFQREANKPILFLETGWCSLSNAADAPWDYTRTELDKDDELQEKLYRGFFQSWYNKPGLGGFMVWEWTPGDGGKGSTEEELKGYTPENKPSEKVIREWLTKSWGNSTAAAQ